MGILVGPVPTFNKVKILFSKEEEEREELVRNRQPLYSLLPTASPLAVTLRLAASTLSLYSQVSFVSASLPSGVINPSANRDVLFISVTLSSPTPTFQSYCSNSISAYFEKKKK